MPLRPPPGLPIPAWYLSQFPQEPPGPAPQSPSMVMSSVTTRAKQRLEGENENMMRRPRDLNQDLYSSGTPLYTKESLLVAERMASECALHSHLALPAFGGGQVIQKLGPRPPAHALDRQGDTISEVIGKGIVRIHGYQTLVDGRSGDRTAYRSPFFVESKDISYEVSVDPDRLLESVMEWIQNWQGTQVCHQLGMLFETIPVKDIDKLICFGLGSLQFVSGQFGRRHWDRYAGALLMARIISLRTGNHCPILSQDPAYTPLDEVILNCLGINIVGRHGAAGFAEIDERSAVFATYAGAEVHEVVADPGIPKPAVIASDCFAGAGVTRHDDDAAAAAGMSSPADMTPDGARDTGSPRVDELARAYVRHGVVCETDRPEGLRTGGIDNLVVSYRFQPLSRDQAMREHRRRFELARSFDVEDDRVFIPNIASK